MTMTIDSYRAVMQKLKNRYSEQTDLRVAMDALVDIAIEDYQTKGLSKKDYWRICVEAANIAYPDGRIEK